MLRAMVLLSRQHKVETREKESSRRGDPANEKRIGGGGGKEGGMGAN